MYLFEQIYHLIFPKEKFDTIEMIISPSKLSDYIEFSNQKEYRMSYGYIALNKVSIIIRE